MESVRHPCDRYAHVPAREAQETFEPTVGGMGAVDHVGVDRFALVAGQLVGVASLGSCRAPQQNSDRSSRGPTTVVATRGLPAEAEVTDPNRGVERFLADLRSIRDDPHVMGTVAAMQFQRQVYLMILSQLERSLDGLIAELAEALQ